MTALVTVTESGLYCPPGGFYIDPWRAVDTAVITHGHGDHARSGSGQYYAAAASEGILRHRLGADLPLTNLAYGAPLRLGDATVSLHPAGHILGSAQVRIEVGGEVWVVSGDYKRTPDPTCTPFEVVACDTFITEATFALPLYRWPTGQTVAEEILAWWQACASAGRGAVLFCYALGKAQRVLSELYHLAPEEAANRPVYVHGAVAPLIDVYREAKIPMLPTLKVSEVPKGQSFAGQLILAPPSAFRSPWMKRLGEVETGFVSGWMRVRGNRRRRGYDRGFVMSDHADWPQLLLTIRETGARRILATHGHSDTLIRFLRETTDLDVQELRTFYGAEDADEEAAGE
jgi:putative mRNA 3-end processing factor